MLGGKEAVFSKLNIRLLRNKFKQIHSTLGKRVLGLCNCLFKHENLLLVLINVCLCFLHFFL